MKPFYIYCEVYEHHFWCAVDMPFDNLEKFVARHYNFTKFEIGDEYREAEGFVFEVSNQKTNQYGTWIVMKTRKPNDVDWLSCLSHECVHAAKALMSYRGLDMEHPGDEPMAYLVGFLFKKILKRARRG